MMFWKSEHCIPNLNVIMCAEVETPKFPFKEGFISKMVLDKKAQIRGLPRKWRSEGAVVQASLWRGARLWSWNPCWAFRGTWSSDSPPSSPRHRSRQRWRPAIMCSYEFLDEYNFSFNIHTGYIDENRKEWLNIIFHPLQPSSGL